MAIGTPSRELSLDIGRSVLTATDHLFPFEHASDTPAYVVWAGGFVARCRQLLSGAVCLLDNEQDDAIGTLYRTLLETFLSGIYVLLGRNEALDVMRRALLNETHNIERALGRAEKSDRPEEAKQLLMSNYTGADGLIERVDQLLIEQNHEYGGWAPAIHRNHYKVLSMHDAHGGLGCLQGYVDDQLSPPSIVGRRAPSETAIFLLSHGIVNVGSFAGLWAQEAQLDATALRVALRRWEEAQPESWNAQSWD